MAKPIVVMYIPEEGVFYSTGPGAAAKLMRILNGNYGKPGGEAGIIYPDYWQEYY